jgi:molybdenum cofactor cytidylyltransferase
VSSIAIVILAAGASKRMGIPKQLLPYRGRTLLHHTVETALGSTCRPVVVVLGAHVEQTHPEVRGLPVLIVQNPQWAEGLGSSIRAGIEALVTSTDPPEAVVLALCDQPSVCPDDLDALVAAYRSTNRPIIASQYAGTLGVPALFAHPILPELVELNGDSGAKQVIQKHLAIVHPVSCPHAAHDLDTPADYEAICPAGSITAPPLPPDRS